MDRKWGTLHSSANEQALPCHMAMTVSIADRTLFPRHYVCSVVDDKRHTESAFALICNRPSHSYYPLRPQTGVGNNIESTAGGYIDMLMHTLHLYRRLLSQPGRLPTDMGRQFLWMAHLANNVASVAGLDAHDSSVQRGLLVHAGPLHGARQVRPQNAALCRASTLQTPGFHAPCNVCLFSYALCRATARICESSDLVWIT